MSDSKFIKKPKSDPAASGVKIPPHSIEAEQSVLGGIMISNDAWDQIADRLVEDDFYRVEHRLIFRAMARLAQNVQPIDVLTIAETLKGLNELDNIGGEVYLFQLAKNTPSAANIKAYASIVRERSVLRQLLGAAQDIASEAFHPEGRASKELLDDAERRIFSIADQHLTHQGPKHINDLVAQAVNQIDMLYQRNEPVTGVSTGFTDLDSMTAGLQPSDMVVIAGRPSMGKTVLGMNIAEAVALDTKKPVLVFSMEMSGESIAMRMVSSLGRIEQNQVRTGGLKEEDWPRITSAVEMLSEVKMYVDDTPGLGPGEMRSRTRRLVREQGPLALIVIDYMQLMRIPGFRENRAAEISEISRSLKGIAKEFNVPVIALSQLNRSLEQRLDKRPVMSDLRDSGSIEQDADLIAFIYRDQVYHPDTTEKNVAEIIIAKQRNGPTGVVKLRFNGQYLCFDNLATTTYERESMSPCIEPPQHA